LSLNAVLKGADAPAMEFETYIAFVLATLLFAAIPGPGVIAISSKSMISGSRPALLMSAGIICGDLTYLLFAILGLAAIAESLGDFFVVVRYIGAGYLIFLGYRMWRDPVCESPSDAPSRWNSNYLKGLFISLGNPKVIMFYLGFIPVFWNLTSLTVSQIVVIVGTILSVLIVVLATYVFLAAQCRRFFGGRVRQMLNRVFGSVLVLLGLRLAHH
jgi:threonine/homoserine/homoserine lactone efflux protein